MKVFLKNQKLDFSQKKKQQDACEGTDSKHNWTLIRNNRYLMAEEDPESGYVGEDFQILLN